MAAVISWWPLDGCYYFLVASGWLLLFPSELWIVAVISQWPLDGYCYSWCPLDGCCYFLVCYYFLVGCYFLVGGGWLLLFLGGL